MVKSDMLYMLDLRLQEIMEKVGIPFGGVAILTFGDMMQLKPCMGRYIFETPINDDFHITHRLEPRWMMFKPIILKINHRQGNDKIYANMLNRIRIGQHTTDDMETLKTRIRKNGHDDLKNVDIFIAGKRKESAEINKKYISKLPGIELNLPAIHHHNSRKKYTPRIDKRDGTVADTGFMDKLKLKLDAKVILIHNISTVDSLTNGQLGILKEAQKTPDGKVEKLVVQFKNKNAGIIKRSQNPYFAQKFPDCVIIERVKIEYSLRKNGGAEGSKASVIQFPIRLAHAITSHKVQGQSIPRPLKVAMDINSVFQAAQAYVMLSRVQSLEQVYIRGSLDAKKIMISTAALAESERLQKRSECGNSWNSDSSDKIRIGILNCAGLRPHFEDILSDEKLLMADCLLFQETSVTTEEALGSYAIPAYIKTVFNCFGNGKGIATYSKINFEKEMNRSETSIQVLKTSFKKLDIINVYRSADSDKAKLIEKLREVINQRRASIIAGDFNICGKTQGNNLVMKYLRKLGFTLMNKEPTHIQGRQIDNIFVNQPKIVDEIERHSVYYSDHDALLLTLNIQVKNYDCRST